MASKLPFFYRTFIVLKKTIHMIIHYILGSNTKSIPTRVLIEFYVFYVSNFVSCNFETTCTRK